jgi:hypothetical protein
MAEGVEEKTTRRQILYEQSHWDYGESTYKYK